MVDHCLRPKFDVLDILRECEKDSVRLAFDIELAWSAALPSRDFTVGMQAMLAVVLVWGGVGRADKRERA